MIEYAIFFVCIYLIGVILAWVLSIGFLHSNLIDPYDIACGFSTVSEKAFNMQYRVVKRMWSDAYRISVYYALLSWLAVCAVIFVMIATSYHYITWKNTFKAMHLFPQRFPSQEELKHIR